MHPPAKRGVLAERDGGRGVVGGGRNGRQAQQQGSPQGGPHCYACSEGRKAGGGWCC